MSITEFADRNEMLCVTVAIVLGVVAITIASLAYNAYVYKVMAQAGYVEVQTMGTTSVHWEKKP